MEKVKTVRVMSGFLTLVLSSSLALAKIDTAKAEKNKKVYDGNSIALEDQYEGEKKHMML